MRIAKRSTQRTYASRGNDVTREVLVDALDGLALAIRLGHPTLAVNPYSANGTRALWRIDWMRDQLERYAEPDIASLKRAAEWRRIFWANLSTASFLLGMLGSFLLYLTSFVLGAGVLMGASFAVVPLSTFVTALFYRNVQAANAVRADLNRWAHALDDARVLAPHTLSRAA